MMIEYGFSYNSTANGYGSHADPRARFFVSLCRATRRRFDRILCYGGIQSAGALPRRALRKWLRRIRCASHGEARFKSVADVIAAAKAQPGRISVGSPGNGTVNQIVLEWMALNTGTKFQHIPYKGSAPAANAIAANEIPLGMLASSSVAPHLKTGRVRVLAVASARRSRFGPDWPTLQEAGVAEVNASTWTALLAPKDTPQPVIDKLNAEVVKVLEMPDIKERFAAGGVDTIPSSPAGLGARIKQDTAQFGMIVQKADIKPD